ncbi:putative glutamate--cysteine ligase 2 [Nakamurella endophytica]|uniref:Putative glutamate--cysteine ligase 2 n=2 Tax=Nakamurella endophytica TaxID=1748367 RepID=A0A917SW39_9ACTN|nr:putative glutamate--cysteine ligase 2 [Nakamurella endophytica]
MGVEEELLLLAADDGRPAPAAPAVIDVARRAAPGDDEPVEKEFKREQAEIGSAPTDDAGELLRDLRSRRGRAAAAAQATGVRLVALATSPLPVQPTPTADERYRRMHREFGVLARQQLACGEHVHVEVASRDEGVGVLDRIAPWLPVLRALSANSPFWQGQDTGYASYRTLAWGSWPSAGPATGFGDAQGYDRAVADLVATGAALDDGMVYFDARLSRRYDTVEVRVADVCTDVADSVLVALLIRGLVDVLAQQWRSGVPVPELRPELLRAATWRAARDGLSGELVDPRGAGLRPAGDVLAALVQLVEPALGRDDADRVHDAVQRLLHDGTGADRQRAVLRRTGSLQAVVTDAAARTLA